MVGSLVLFKSLVLFWWIAGFVFKSTSWYATVSLAVNGFDAQVLHNALCTRLRMLVHALSHALLHKIPNARLYTPSHILLHKISNAR